MSGQYPGAKPWLERLEKEPELKLALVQDFNPTRRVGFIRKEVPNQADHIEYYQKLGNIALPLLDVLNGVFREYNGPIVDNFEEKFITRMFARERRERYDPILLMHFDKSPFPEVYHAPEVWNRLNNYNDLLNLIVKRIKRGQVQTPEEYEFIRNLCSEYKRTEFDAWMKTRADTERNMYLVDMLWMMSHCFIAFSGYSNFYSRATKLLGEYWSSRDRVPNREGKFDANAPYFTYSLIDVCNVAMGVQERPMGVAARLQDVPLPYDWLEFLGPDSPQRATVVRLFLRLGMTPLGAGNPYHSPYMLDKHHLEVRPGVVASLLVDAWSMLFYMYVCMVGRGAKYGPIMVHEHNAVPRGPERVNTSTILDDIPVLRTDIDLRVGEDEPIGFAWKTLHMSVLQMSTEAYIEELKLTESYNTGTEIPECNAFGLLLDMEQNPIPSRTRTVRNLIESGSMETVFIYMPRLPEEYATSDVEDCPMIMQEMALVNLLFHRELVYPDDRGAPSVVGITPYVLGFDDAKPDEWHYNYMDGVFDRKTLEHIPNRAFKNLDVVKQGPSDDDFEAWAKLRNAMFFLTSRMCDRKQVIHQIDLEDAYGPRRFFLGFGAKGPNAPDDNVPSRVYKGGEPWIVNDDDDDDDDDFISPNQEGQPDLQAWIVDPPVDDDESMEDID